MNAQRSPRRRALLACLLVLAIAGPGALDTAQAGAYIFAGEDHGLDLILHPQGYTGAESVVTVEVCIDPDTQVPSGAALADLETPVRNIIAVWNAHTPTLGNVLLGGANDVPFGTLDFESIALHELGHCIGLAHVNAASESGLPGNDANYTKATPGPNGVLNVSPGPDGVRGTLDDLRGDDANLHWFRRDSNDPGQLPLPNPIDASTYARDLAALPAGHTFAQNLDRDAAGTMGHPDTAAVRTEAVMQQGSFADEAQRALTADGVATLRLAMSGADEIAGTADDYVVNLVYGGITDAASCDLDLQFTDMTGLAFCSVGGLFIDSPPGTIHARITTGFMEFGTGFNWFFNQDPATCTPSAGVDTTCDGIDDDCDGQTDEDTPSTPTTCGVGECAGNSGSTSCVNGTLVDTCDPLAGASAEICDDLDNDCDGATDDGIPAVPSRCGLGDCADNTGLITCVGGAPADSCDPLAGATQETCDGRDNDCDGPIDEGLPATPTTCGTGACAGNSGTRTCIDGASVDDCDPLAGAAAESCDGLDNDCDGVTDDGIPAQPTSCGLGECAGNSGSRTCDGGVLVDDCDPFAGAGPDICDGLDNDCDGAVDQACVGPRLETGRTSTGATRVTVNLSNTYVDPVVVATVHYVANTTPVVTRVSNVTATSFDVRLQNPSDGPVAADDVSFVVVERGTWIVDGVKLEAQKYLSGVTSHKNAWSAEPQAYGQSYTAPVVLGQVMSENDPDWSVFFDQGATRSAPPSPGALATGKTVAGDTDTTRAAETIGFIVIETAHGTLGGVAFEAAVGSDTVMGVDNAPPYAYDFAAPFAAAPAVALTTLAAVDGSDGGWAQVHGAPAASATRLFLSVDEDQVGDAERAHTHEQVAYLVFAAQVVFPPGPQCAADGDCDDGDFCNGSETCDTAAGICRAGADPCVGLLCDEVGDRCVAGPTARLESVSVIAGAAPTPVALQHDYLRPVVTCTPVYSANTVPVVVRLDRVNGDGFDIRLQNPGGGSPVVADPVHCLVVEEGSWTIDGHAVEARRYLSTVTDHKTSWGGAPQTLAQPFANPVVMGQVMTSNDADWSVYWQQGALRNAPPTAGALRNGKTVMEDPRRARADEEIGFIVFEQGGGTLGGVAFQAALGPDSVLGIDNAPPFHYTFASPFAGPPQVVVGTTAGVDGADGAWTYLFGAAFATSTRLALTVDEDQLAGAERAHTSEQVAYVAFQSPVVAPDASCSTDAECDDGAFCNGLEACDGATGTCLPGTPVLCDDGIACTADACNDSTFLCDSTPVDGACDDGVFCNGAETCDPAGGCLAGTDPCAGESCDESLDICPGAGPVAQMEWGRVDGVDGSPTTVALTHGYFDPVVVTSLRYAANTLPVVIRVAGVTGTSFDVYLQNPSGSPVAPDSVNYLVVERGVWVIDGVPVEAQKYTSTVTAHDGDWGAFDPQAYGQAYADPVVLGQVMSTNDPDFSTFWSRGPSRTSAPTSAAINTGKMVAEDPDTTRDDETVGFIVIDAAHGTIGGIEFEAGLSADSVAGVANTPPYIQPFAAAFGSVPAVAVVTQAGMDGGNGGWMVTYGAAQATSSELRLASDEDQLADAERSKGTEQAGYCVFAAPGAFPAP